MSILASEAELVAQPARRRGWQAELARAVRDASELCRLLDLPREVEATARRATGDFPIFAPLGYVARMRPRDTSDPLLRQVLPLDDELAQVPGFDADPVQDLSSVRARGLLQKYRGRALMVTTGACAVHCRYCFRRHFPYSSAPKSVDDWAEALAHIAADASIHEVILSGGDPLTLVDGTLAELARRLASIAHLRRLRIHTRLPIVLEERVDDALLAWLAESRLRPIMVVHANHPNELNEPVARALARLAEARVLLLNQAVLLAGVNDTADSLAELSERLLDMGVTPYYLHQLDRVAGAAHFEVDEARGLAIVDELRRRLPGYAVPRYVREVAGEGSKIEIRGPVG